MPEKTISALSRVLFDSQMVTARLLLALAEFLWGVLLLWPGDTFERPTYSIMALVMSELPWAGFFLTSAAMQVWILASEDYHSRPARAFAAWNAIFWASIACSMLLSVYPPPAAISGEIALAIAAVWIWLRPHLICRWITDARQCAPLR